MIGTFIIFLATGILVAILGVLVYGFKRPVGPAGSAVGLTRVVAIGGLILLGAVNLWAIVSTLIGESVEVTVPVNPYWPEHPNITEVYPNHGDQVSSVITEAQVTTSVLSVGTRLLLAGGILLEASAVLAVLIAVIVLCNNLRSLQPFTARMQRTGRITAAVIAVGSFAGQILSGFGAGRAGDESISVFSWASEGLAEPIDVPWPVPTWYVSLDFGPFFLALGILVVVELVTAGVKLGQEHRKLQADTDGLV